MPSPYTPPIAVPAGQIVVWAVAGNSAAQAFNDCSAATTNITGSQSNPTSAPFGPPPNFYQYESQCDWLNYSIPEELTRPGTVVHGIYPTIVGFGNNVHSFFQFTLGNSTTVTGPATSGSFSGQWYFNFGTNPALISTIGNQTFMESTLPIGNINDYFITEFVAVAIYITAPPIPSVYVSVGNQQHRSIGND
jgi:hypothetical protein